MRFEDINLCIFADYLSWLPLDEIKFIYNSVFYLACTKRIFISESYVRILTYVFYGVYVKRTLSFIILILVLLHCIIITALCGCESQLHNAVIIL